MPERKLQRAEIPLFSPRENRVEYVKKEVRFPERIVADTGGVLGYERSAVDHETLRKPLLKLLNGKIELPDEAVGSEKFWSHFTETRVISGEKHRRLSDNGKTVEKSISKISDELIDIFSRGRFPGRTLNHVYRGVWGTPESLEPTLREGLIMQKVFHPETAFYMAHKQMPAETAENIPGFNFVTWSGDVTYGLMRKDSNGSVDCVAKEELEQYSGLPNLTRLLSNEIGQVKVANINYTDSKNSVRIWHKGLQEILRFLKENPSYFLISAGEHGFERNSAYTGLATAGYTSRGGDGKPNTHPGLNGAMVGFNMENKAFAGYIQKIGEEIESLNDKDKKRELFQLAIRHLEQIRTNDFRGKDVGVPIIIDHPNIPELRWCHGQYAVIPTKGKFNFLKMIS